MPDAGDPPGERGPRRPIYRGSVLDVGIEPVVLPNGHAIDLEIVRHPGGAAVVALDERERVCVLRQYRHAAGGWLWELPAGKIDDREPPLETARRELSEEAGVTARQWTALGHVHSSPGIFTEIVHLYLATGLQAVAAANEPAEIIEVHWLPWREALDRALAGGIDDAKTVAGLCRAGHVLRHRTGR